MSAPNLRQVRTFKDLIRYLEDELHWPLDGYEMEDLTFDYEPADLGLKDEDAAKVKTIRQLRPLASGQPWGIFFIDFDKKKLPVVVLRRILSHLVIKKRASANKADSAAWNTQDILFVSAFGPEDDNGREIGFAHFHEESGDLPSLRVLGWDGADTALKLQSIASTLRERLHWPVQGESADAWRQRWSGAFKHRPGHVIRTADLLAEALAALAKRIRDAARTLMEHETERGPLRTLHKAFQTNLIHDLNEDGFADTYAQTITYGLLTAAINRTEMSGGRHGTFVKAEDVALAIKPTSPFLKEMLETFLKVGGRKGHMDFDELGVQDVVELLRSDITDIPAILADFGNKTRGEDPVIHFYEHFLSAYNKKLKVQRGVFYTPQPVVGYIVRSVHELLQTEFGLEDGLASTATWAQMLKKHPDLKLPPLTDEPGEKQTIGPDEMFVQILDPATGTATFLVEVIDVIYKHLKDKWAKSGLTAMPVLPGATTDYCKQFTEYWNLYVPAGLLPRLHGYELMMAPYAIAHMKIGLKLTELGYNFASDARAQIYLTNALEPWVKQLPLIGFDALAHEAAAVNEIKRHKRFTVVIGNPPYSGLSANMSPLAQRLVDAYKWVDGQPLNERKLWLQDDYVKFIRFSEIKLESSGCGVIGLISNHAFLDNPTFRGMRNCLLNSFNSLDFLDLGGNVMRGKGGETHSEDENVFAIQQGVSISFLTRGIVAKSGFGKIRFAAKIGRASQKNSFLIANSLSSTLSEGVDLVPPFYLFVPQSSEGNEEFKEFVPIPDIFIQKGVGVVTACDSMTIAWDQESMIAKLEKFVALPVEQARMAFDLGPDARDWTIKTAQDDARKTNWDSEHIVSIQYRPFDYRTTLFTGHSRGFYASPCTKTMKHLLGLKNLALVYMRQVASGGGYSHFMVSRSIVDARSCYSNKGTMSLAPLYLLAENDLLKDPVSNFNPVFLAQLSATLSAQPNPEDIFHYAYAVFHSPGYRSRYAEFLKIDFPRLPLTGNLELFRILARLGGELTALHLLESPKLDQTITEFIGTSRDVTKVGYTNDTVWINAIGTKGKSGAGTSGFRGVPEAVWNFHIGGYQVCEKWLKDRKGRTLTDEDIAHYHKIVVALTETIRLMAEIDAVIAHHGGWPGAFSRTAED